MENQHYKINNKNLINYLKNFLINDVINIIGSYLEEPFELYGKKNYNLLLEDFKNFYLVPIQVPICNDCRCEEEQCGCLNGIQILEPDFNFETETVFYLNQSITKKSEYNSKQITILLESWKLNLKRRNLCKYFCLDRIKNFFCKL
tara:strand:- start:778 stop:1215 length:438 start_codon:yes stop_codon:yes gene_type:complete